ncbi:Gldg family protein [candidate division KSB1 bacterium]|nr:Gldg family protein [candidate division KSB1 bacterium]
MMKKYSNWIGLLGLLFVLAGLVTYSISTMINTLVTILLVIGVILLVGYVILQFREIKSGLSSRSAKFGANAALMVIFLLGILVVVNILGHRFSYRSDLTAARIFSLAEQTRKVLKNLDKDVNVIGFFKAGEESQAREFMIEYSHFSQRFKYEFIDPDKEPGLAKKYDIKSYGTIVLECEDKQEKINTVSEEEITNALIKVTREGVKRILFTTGHGEKDYDDSEQGGLSKAKNAIAELNYDIDKVFLVQAPDTLGADVALIVMAGPMTDLLSPERGKLDDYLTRGGKLLLMLDPESPASYGDFLADWGVELGNDLIIELSPVGQLFGAGPIMPVVTSYEKHAIVEGFGGAMTLFSEARSVGKMTDPPAGVTVTEIAKTSNNSWGETSAIGADGQVGFDPADNQGPLAIFTIAEKSATTFPPAMADELSGPGKGRVAVFGDADFATNAYFNFQANGNLFLNVVNWLAEEEDLISIMPRDPEDRRLSMTAQQSKLMLWLGVILLPLAVFGLGIYVYRRRK